MLRAWRVEDAAALAAAWADEAIQRWTVVPGRRDVAAAARWIRGDAARRRRWLSVDLVVERASEVVGEVGLAAIDRATGTAEIGWWTAAPHRRTGVASTAVDLLATWARSALGLAVVARCDPANVGALAVARRAGVPVVHAE